MKSYSVQNLLLGVVIALLIAPVASQADSIYASYVGGGYPSANGVFAVNPTTGNRTQIYNQLASQLVYGDGALYGVFSPGGSFNGVFTIDVVTGDRRQLSNAVPDAVTYGDGLLYLSLSPGGCGTCNGLFSLDPATSILAPVRLSGGDAGPVAIAYGDGVIYASYVGGGYPSANGVFAVNPTTGDRTQIYNQVASHLVYGDGALYGVFSPGGGFNGVFTIDVVTGDRRQLSNAVPGAVTYGDGLLYLSLSPGGCGTCNGLFSLDPATSILAPVRLSGGDSGPVALAYEIEVVPIVPAVWLFGSALSLMGVVRRKKTVF